MKNYKKNIIIALNSILLTILLVMACNKVNNIYYEKWPLQGDTASYWLRDLALLENSNLSTNIEVIWEATKNNSRDPLRTLSFALLGPKKILSINGHLIFSGFAAFIFLFTFSQCLWARTGLLTYTLAIPFATLLPLGLLNPMYGMPSKLPDIPAAFLFGSSLFVIFINKSKPDLKILFISGALLGLSVLTRYHVWVYGLFVIGPIITFHAIDHYLRSERSIKFFIIQHVYFLLGLMLVAGWFILANAIEVFKFYLIAGYGLNKTLWAALTTTGYKLIIQYFGIQAFIVFFLIFISYFSIAWGNSKKYFLHNLTICWAGLSCIFLILIIMRVEDDITQTYYMMPGLCILFLSPFNIKSELISNESKIIFFRYTKCVSLILPIFIISNYLIWIKSEGFVYPRPHSQKLFEFNRALVSEINNSLSLVKNNSPVIDTNFDYYARYIVPELMLRFNRLGRQGNVFQIRKSQWKISGPFPDNLTHSLHFSSDMEKDNYSCNK